MPDKKLIIEKIIQVLKKIQEEGGFEQIEINLETNPVKDMPEFDSQLWIVAITILAEELQIVIPNNLNIFISENGEESPNIEEIAQRILDALQYEGGKNGK